MAAVVALGATACLPTTGPPPADPYQNMLFNAMNQDRAVNGLPPLTWSPELSVLAGGWSAEMSQTYLHHRNLGEVMTWEDYQEYGTLGENILVGPPGYQIADMEAAWMGSPGHRANILSPNFNVVGVAFVSGPDGRIWVTVNFGGV